MKRQKKKGQTVKMDENEEVVNRKLSKIVNSKLRRKL